MILARNLSTALRANSTAKISCGNGAGESKPVFLGVLGLSTELSSFVNRVFCFCSSSGGWRDSPPHDEALDSNNAVWGSPNLATVIALPLSCYPLLPSEYIFTIKDPTSLALLNSNRKTGVRYAGAFLLKDKPLDDQGINNLKGKELLKQFHKVGTLVEIIDIQEEKVSLRARSRLQIAQMVEEDPLAVKVENLKDYPYVDKYDYDFKSFIVDTNYELKTHIDYLTCKYELPDNMNSDEVNSASAGFEDTQIQKGDLSYLSASADYLASIMGLNKLIKQQVLEELNVFERIKLVFNLDQDVDDRSLRFYQDKESPIDPNKLLQYYNKEVPKTHVDSNRLLQYFIKKERQLRITTSYYRSAMFKRLTEDLKTKRKEIERSSSA